MAGASTPVADSVNHDDDDDQQHYGTVPVRHMTAFDARADQADEHDDYYHNNILDNPKDDHHDYHDINKQR